jgi:hypothetical protein
MTESHTSESVLAEIETVAGMVRMIGISGGDVQWHLDEARLLWLRGEPKEARRSLSAAVVALCQVLGGEATVTFERPRS